MPGRENAGAAVPTAMPLEYASAMQSAPSAPCGAVPSGLGTCQSRAAAARPRFEAVPPHGVLPCGAMTARSARGQGPAPTSQQPPAAPTSARWAPSTLVIALFLAFKLGMPLGEYLG